MQENLIEFVKENDISILVVGDTSENLFQIHYGLIKCSSSDLIKQLIEYGGVFKLNESCEGQLILRIWSQGKHRQYYANCVKIK